jgi:hypothetical protein
MSNVPWRQAQTTALRIAAKLDAELAGLRGKFDQGKLGAADYCAKIAGAVTAIEQMANKTLDQNEPPLSPKMAEARVDHQAVRVECRETIREAVSEFM